MWSVILICGILSGCTEPVICRTAREENTSSLDPLGVYNLTRDDHEPVMSPVPGMSRLGGKSSRAQVTKYDGCPAEIPIIEDGKIMAARIWRQQGNDIPELSCNGGYEDWFAGTKDTQGGDSESGFRIAVSSIFVNPGCHVVLFKDHDFKRDHKSFTPGLYPNPKIERPIGPCLIQNRVIPCVGSMLFSCQQTYPTCTPSDSWETVTEIDNSGSSVTSTFTYKKEVGTTFSQEMQNSQSVSKTVSAELEIAFWGNTAKLGVSSTTGFDWTKTDSTTKSETTSFTVEVEVPPGVKMSIQDAVGTCGGSKIHTQLFRILDSNPKKDRIGDSEKVVKTSFQGRMDKYSLSRIDFMQY